MKPLNVVLTFTLSLGAAAYAADAEPADSLYHRLGGEPAVHAVVEDFVQRVLADAHVNRWFEHVAKDAQEAAEYKQHLSEFLCKTAGGPCAYHGKDMVAAHHGMHVTEEAFAAVARHLEEALTQAKVREAEKRELMTLVGGLKAAVVQK
jgi:hemoglobin